MAAFFLACEEKEGLVAEARLLLAIQGQMPSIRMLRAKLVERRPTWDTSMLTIKVLSCGAGSAEGTGAKAGPGLKEKGASS